MRIGPKKVYSYSPVCVGRFLPLAQFRLFGYFLREMASHSGCSGYCNISFFFALLLLFSIFALVPFLLCLRVASFFVHFPAPARSAILIVQFRYGTFRIFHRNFAMPVADVTIKSFSEKNHHLFTTFTVKSAKKLYSTLCTQQDAR